MRGCIAVSFVILVAIAVVIVLISKFLATKVRISPFHKNSYYFLCLSRKKQGKVHIYATNLRCFNVNTEIVQLDKCQLDQIRGRKGVINGFGRFREPLNDIWVR